MTNFHGWTDHKTFVAVTVGRTKRYGIAMLGKEDKFDLVFGAQVALLRLFSTPKTLPSKPRGMPFDVKVSIHNLYYEVWRLMVVKKNCDSVDFNTRLSRCLDIVAPNIKVAIIFRAPGIETGAHFMMHPEYAPTGEGVLKTLMTILEMSSEQRDQLAVETIKGDNQLETLDSIVKGYRPAIPTSTALADNPLKETGLAMADALGKVAASAMLEQEAVA